MLALEHFAVGFPLIPLFSAVNALPRAATLPAACSSLEPAPTIAFCLTPPTCRCRSDIEFAALQGPDPQPDRSHVFYLRGWEASQRVHGGELVRCVALLGWLAAGSPAGISCCAEPARQEAGVGGAHLQDTTTHYDIQTACSLQAAGGQRAGPAAGHNGGGRHGGADRAGGPRGSAGGCMHSQRDATGEGAAMPGGLPACICLPACLPACPLPQCSCIRLHAPPFPPRACVWVSRAHWTSCASALPPGLCSLTPPSATGGGSSVPRQRRQRRQSARRRRQRAATAATSGRGWRPSLRQRQVAAAVAAATARGGCSGAA